MDDLDNFFAKKAAKKNKKIVAQDTDALARRLEKAVKQQEQLDHDREEEDRILKERQMAVENQQPNPEDSEWIDIEQDVLIDPLSVGLHELNIDEREEENESVDSGDPVEKPKTWNQIDSSTTLEEPKEEVAPEPLKSNAYVPPSRRVLTKTSIEPNLQDVAEFPSLMAAVDISKKEVEIKKIKAQREKDVLEQEKARSIQRRKVLDELTKEEKVKETPSVGVAPTGPAKYVPPHLRPAQPQCLQ
uniref:Uncharacterized protein n=1 Tax=Romanomermis culicivorax TaxID=13658 RepID=A0A915KAB5_ROMCU